MGWGGVGGLALSRKSISYVFRILITKYLSTKGVASQLFTIHKFQQGVLRGCRFKGKSEWLIYGWRLAYHDTIT